MSNIVDYLIRNIIQKVLHLSRVSS